MSDIIIEGFSTIISLAVGGLIGYAYAYFSGLKAVRKGMQLMLRGCLDGFGRVRTGSDRFGQVRTGSDRKPFYVKSCPF